MIRVIDMSGAVTLKKRRTSVTPDKNASDKIEDRVEALETRVKEILPRLGPQELIFINIACPGSRRVELNHNLGTRVAWYVSSVQPGDVWHIGTSPQVSEAVNGLTLRPLSTNTKLVLEVGYVGIISVTVRSIQ